MPVNTFKSLFFSLVIAAGQLWCASAHAETYSHSLSVIEKIFRNTSKAAHNDSLAGTQASSVVPGVGFAACPHLFPGKTLVPEELAIPKMHAIGLCADNFATVYSKLTKTPLVVIEKLNAQSLDAARQIKRTNVFYPDPRLSPSERAELEDYRGSGLDKGHMANAADQPDDRAMAQSFVLSNMVPQDPTNNQTGAWSKVEIDTRKFVRRARGNVFIFSGPLFNDRPRTIGLSRVWVPSHLFKLTYDESTGKAWAHIIPNTAEAVLQRPITYAEFVAQTGLQLLQGVTHSDR